MIKTYQVALSASAVRLSTQFAGDESQNIPFRQLTLTATGAAAAIGGTSSVTAPTGYPIAIAGQLTLGPFSTGPVKLSDLYAIGAGATLTIIGIPF